METEPVIASVSYRTYLETYNQGNKIRNPDPDTVGLNPILELKLI